MWYARLPAHTLSLVIVRDVDLIAAVSYVRYKTVPPPVNTAIQLFLVAASLASSVFHFRQSAPADPTVYHTGHDDCVRLQLLSLRHEDSCGAQQH
ncbi:cardiolipin synthase (CMP-forming) [Oncorhynchus keta]|uniref:cardiolipin synthase (CMP-forming) n=1 Tax=Oncorhynchus keta TaxID=8018 RepID=UPI0015FE1BE7|nr:cardiolipin synthase (CMP-forming) [Oncorhynchus keta]XP_035607983.1 cardiolipin synthase (CMP-forming) [Oncorhynchus keta]